MSLLNFLRSFISPQNSLLLLYHKIKAVIAAIIYRFPADHLKVIAVTGTKGKSTVCYLLSNILREAGHRVGSASTIEFRVGENVFQNDTKQTTQGPFFLQRLLREMVKARCEFAVIEVTSHALVQSRIWGINVDTAVLTNIQRDHLEYHGGFENYIHAKGLLFASLNRFTKKFGLQKTAVLPSEDANIAYFKTFPVDRQIEYGISKGTITAENVVLNAQGSTFRLRVPNEEILINLNLPGEFNIKNSLAASTAAISLDINLSAIKKGLESASQIPGRLEIVNVGQPFTVVVDYAHTPESLEQLLKVFKPLTKGKLFLVFGATGGGRDKSKRPIMGQIADKYADMIIVTDDDPYTEDRVQIIEQISEGIKRKEGENFWKIRDRRQSIRLALTLAQENDTVIIAGKGCESVQMVGNERIEWDDRKVVREILSSAVKIDL